MFRRKKIEDPCTSCDRVVKLGQKTCSCGAPTRYMDFSERTDYEVQQWRAHRHTATA